LIREVTIIALIALAAIANISTYYVQSQTKHPPITVDGDPVDWLGTSDITDNTYTIDYWEFIWKDAPLDEVTAFVPSGSHDKAVDLTEFRVAYNDTHVFFMLKFNDMSLITKETDTGLVWDTLYIGDDGAPIIIITIDTDLATEEDQWYPAGAETLLVSKAYWEYAVGINLADAVYTDKGLRSVDSGPQKGEGSIFWIVDEYLDKFYIDVQAKMAVDLDLNTIEVCIPLSFIGTTEFRVTVITGRGYSYIFLPGIRKGGFKVVSGSGNSNILDVISDLSTSQEISDLYVDYYLTIDLTQLSTTTTTTTTTTTAEITTTTTTTTPSPTTTTATTTSPTSTTTTSESPTATTTLSPITTTTTTTTTATTTLTTTSTTTISTTSSPATTTATTTTIATTTTKTYTTTSETAITTHPTTTTTQIPADTTTEMPTNQTTTTITTFILNTTISTTTSNEEPVRTSEPIDETTTQSSIQTSTPIENTTTSYQENKQLPSNLTLGVVGIVAIAVVLFILSRKK
jgi:hypothetical protein